MTWAVFVSRIKLIDHTAKLRDRSFFITAVMYIVWTLRKNKLEDDIWGA